MNTLTKSIILCLTIMSTIFYLNASEPIKIGRIVKLRGDIIRTNKNLTLNESLSQGNEIYEGDELNSSKGGYVKILMIDDTVLQIGANSQLSFEQFMMKSISNRKSVYHLLKGQLRGLFLHKSKEEMIIKTPNAAMGVRGTSTMQAVAKEGDFHSCLIGKCNLSRTKPDGAIEQFDMIGGQYLEISHETSRQESIKDSVRTFPKETLQELIRKDDLLFPHIKNMRMNFSTNNKYQHLKKTQDGLKKSELTPESNQAETTEVGNKEAKKTANKRNNKKITVTESLKQEQKKKQLNETKTNTGMLPFKEQNQGKNVTDRRKRNQRLLIKRPPPPPPRTPSGLPAPPPPDGDDRSVNVIQ